MQSNRKRENKEILDKIKKCGIVRKRIENFTYDVIEEFKKRDFEIRNVCISSSTIEFRKNDFFVVIETDEIIRTLFYIDYKEYEILIEKFVDSSMHEFIEIFKQKE